MACKSPHSFGFGGMANLDTKFSPTANQIQTPAHVQTSTCMKVPQHGQSIPALKGFNNGFQSSQTWNSSVGIDYSSSMPHRAHQFHDPSAQIPPTSFVSNMNVTDGNKFAVRMQSTMNPTSSSALVTTNRNGTATSNRSNFHQCLGCLQQSLQSQISYSYQSTGSSSLAHSDPYQYHTYATSALSQTQPTIPLSETQQMYPQSPSDLSMHNYYGIQQVPPSHQLPQCPSSSGYPWNMTTGSVNSLPDCSSMMPSSSCIQERIPQEFYGDSQKPITSSFKMDVPSPRSSISADTVGSINTSVLFPSNDPTRNTDSLLPPPTALNLFSIPAVSVSSTSPSTDGDSSPSLKPKARRRTRRSISPKKETNRQVNHNQSRPHSCSVCQKKFSTKFNMERHKRSHSNEKPYECLYCSRRFGRQDHWSRHLKNVHKDKCVNGKTVNLRSVRRKRTNVEKTNVPAPTQLAFQPDRKTLGDQKLMGIPSLKLSHSINQPPESVISSFPPFSANESFSFPL